MAEAAGIPGEAPALIVTRPGSVALGRRPVLPPGPDELLVRVAFSGVSVGTELLAATGKREFWGPTPFVPGYQAVGEIVARGSGVSTAQVGVGDTVACFAMGAHGRYVCADVEFAHRLGPSPLLESAALFVPPAVGVNALNIANVGAGDSVLVVGQGLIGQATAAMARLRGAYVIGTDLSRDRLAVATLHCVDEAIDASVAPASQQLGERFPGGLDVVIETTGETQVVDDAMRCVRNRGRFVFLGFYPDGLSFDYALPHAKQITAFFPSLLGDRQTRESVIRSLMRGVPDLSPLISDIVPWTEAATVYSQLFTAQRTRFGGVVIDWRGAA